MPAYLERMDVNWQPLSMLPLVAALIDDGLENVEAQLANVTEARARPWVLDDATVARLERLFDDEPGFLATYDEQLTRWERERLGPEEEREIARLRDVVARTRVAVTAIRPIIEELKSGTIERVLRRVDEITSKD